MRDSREIERTSVGSVPRQKVNLVVELSDALRWASVYNVLKPTNLVGEDIFQG